ncbi:MAG: Modulator of FtsH protease HflC [Gammaproteobacteria bacterium]|nr:Modulator of FtsH protease HflC [Gammaproteobacteria bacterium]
MNGKALFGLIVLVILVVLASATLYTVDEREKAIVFRFGEIVESFDEPGLHWKYPFINNVRKFDARIQTMDANPQEYLTDEKKNLVVDSFVKWRVDDVATYYVTVSGDKVAAQRRLAQRVNNSLREEFGKRSVQEVISGDRSQIMDVVQKATDEQARAIGVEVVDVRLKRVDLVDEVSERVYRRMESERSRVAKELRAKGAEEAEKIRSNADRQRLVTIANAQRDGQKLRGEGDAGATQIYAEAFGQDDDFYGLYRSLNAYEATFASKSDLLVLEPDSQFFKYFNNAVPPKDVERSSSPRQ